MSGLNPLYSKVGRRIALVVLIAAAIPLAVFGSVVFTRARGQLETQHRQRLREDVKTTALNGLDRLLMLEAGLRALAGSDQDDDRARARLDESPAFDHVDTLAVLAPDDQPMRRLRGDAAVPHVASDARARLRDGGAMLVHGEGGGTWLAAGTSGGVVALGTIPYADVFGYGERSALRPGSHACLLDTSRTLLSCSEGTEAAIGVLNPQHLPAHGEATLTFAGSDYLVRTWALPLQHDYAAGTWTVVMLVPRAEATAPLQQMRRDLLLLAAASLLVVLLTVLATVRRHLRPLTALGQAASQVRRQQYDLQLQVHTGDEFETLADGFTSMVTAIRDHIEELEAFSVGAATALARTIDAKSPWTAGHSERVTAMALRIGQAMGLAPDDLVVLQRGGLLHDIGKLATPPEILDKPGPPTVDERRQLEQHPRDGVRILEPIAEFAPLLPIVLQHHERYDGKGYPDQVAGDDIHPLARVLAVADVFDALRSDRPYRAGMPLLRVLDYIRSGAGTQFDPRVVDAFLTVMASAEDDRVPASPPVAATGTPQWRAAG